MSREKRDGTMKKWCVLTAVLAVATIVLAIGWGVRDYLYDVRINQFIKLADDASTPAAKYSYLLKYRAGVVEHIARNSGRYIFRRERLTKDAQLANLDTLVERLEDIKVMPPDALAYQQGMLQISGQEFDHTLGEINGVFWDCYTRESFFLRYAIADMFVASLVLAMAAGFVSFMKFMDRNSLRS